MKKGSTGEGVKSLQTALNKLMAAGLKVDGIFGADTDAAVRAFQRQAGLVVDGIVGQNTLNALKDRLAKMAPAPVSEGPTKVDTSKDSTINPDGGKVKVDTSKDTTLQQEEAGIPTAAKVGLGLLAVFGVLKWRKVI